MYQGAREGQEELLDRLMEVMDKHRDTFFVVQLLPPGPPRDVRDPDPNMGCELMDGRDQFLW